MFARSSAFVDKWIAELAVKPVLAAVAADAKPAKAGKAPAAASSSTPAADASSMSKCCFMVGKVVEVSKHPESDKLYVEKIDLGEETGPRTILSGLQHHITEEAFLNKYVLVAANLEPRKIGGIPSAGMVLCAGNDDRSKIEVLNIPEGVPCGERIIFPGHDLPAEPVLKKKLAKHYESVAVDLKTDDKGNAVWQGIPFMTSKGPITSGINNGIVS
eukprot:TRINITY_DN16517_c0_g1_i2.p1 TRINITY_DN16517_c0_g1~~TRINITY_DN16517_c0_g1_i2.p1  ORF type:complete len:216 (-),score=88.19 TRINITY_DN16517_c0_g1_i2:102-749(-)